MCVSVCEVREVRGQGLCINLRGGGLLIDGLLPQVVAALVLLLHAVDEEEDEEHGEHQAHGAGDQSWKRPKPNIRTEPDKSPPDPETKRKTSNG